MYDGDKWQYYNYIDRMCGYFIKSVLSKDTMNSCITHDDLHCIGVDTLLECAEAFNDLYHHNFGQYLKRALYNRFMTYLKKERSMQNRTINIHETYTEEATGRERLPTDDVDISEYATPKEQTLIDTIADCRLIDRQMFVAYYYEDMTLKEIAKIGNVTYQNVSLRIKKVQEKIRLEVTL